MPRAIRIATPADRILHPDVSCRSSSVEPYAYHIEVEERGNPGLSGACLDCVSCHGGVERRRYSLPETGILGALTAPSFSAAANFSDAHALSGRLAVGLLMAPCLRHLVQ